MGTVTPINGKKKGGGGDETCSDTITPRALGFLFSQNLNGTVEILVVCGMSPPECELITAPFQAFGAVTAMYCAQGDPADGLAFENGWKDGQEELKKRISQVIQPSKILGADGFAAKIVDIHRKGTEDEIHKEQQDRPGSGEGESDSPEGAGAD